MGNKVRGKAGAGIDTKDDNDFPDLAAANAALEEQRKIEEEQREKHRIRIANKKAGNSPWGNQNNSAKNTRLNNSNSNSDTRQPVKIAPPKKEIEPTPPPVVREVEETVAVPTPAVAALAAAAPIPVTKKKKKKKKDLSTFQPAS